MRLIDADRLINSIICYADKKAFNNGYTTYCNGILSTKGLVREQPTIEVPQWIPVEERLPKENGWYLVSYKNKEIGVFCKCGVNELSENVIAWMELPQPYQKGTQ